MGKVIQMPFSELPREFITESALELATDPGTLIETAAVDGDVVLRAGGVEMWFSVEEFGELLEQWSETLKDAAE